MESQPKSVSIKDLRNSDPYARRLAVRALGQGARLQIRTFLGSPRLSEVLQPALGDGDAHVRAEAAWAMGERPDVATATILANRLDQEQEPNVRAMLVDALGRIDGSEAQRAVERVLNSDPVVEVRLEAVRALGRMGSGLAALQKAAMSDPSRAVCRAARAWLLGS